MTHPRQTSWTSGDLLAALERFKHECVMAGMSPNSVHSYWDYARRFLSWRDGEYRPRGASGSRRRPPDGAASTTDLSSETDEYARELASAGLRPAAIDTYHRHAMFFVRWLGGEDAPGSRLLKSKTESANTDQRKSAAWVLEHALDVSFGELFAWLKHRREESIDAHTAIPTRLSNVLARWRGTKWGPYVGATPREFMERRNAGIGSLEALLGAAVAAEGRPPFMAASTQQPPEAVPPAGQPRNGVDDDDVTVPLRTVIAWGAIERGREDLGEILSLAQEDPGAPTEVADAIARLRSYNWRHWATSLAVQFDPLIPLRDFVAGLTEEDRAIVRERLVAMGGRATLDELAKRRNLTRERIRQIETRIAKRMHALPSTHAALERAVRRIRDGIGLAMLAAHVPEANGLTELRLASLDGDQGRILTWLAGPYDQVGEWLVRRPAQQAVEATRTALRRLTEAGPAAVGDVETELLAMGLVSSELTEWIVSVGGFRIHEDRVVRWGGSMADKAEVVLRLDGSPLDRDELASRLGSGTNWRSMTNQLYGDPRFKRTGVRTIGLAEWEHDEYTGVADEIAQEIERQGGEAPLDHLVAHVSTTYGASEASVRAYASGPRFERSDTGGVRLRTTSRPRTGARPLEMTRGAFLVDGRWGLRVRVNDQHLRGSGTVISEGIAGIFGLEPLGATELESEFGGVRLAWPTLSPHIGTIRPALEGLGADEGDIVFLVPEGDRITFRHVPRSMLEALGGLERLAAEVGAGGNSASPLESVVRALGLAEASTAMTVARRLRARGEDELAALAVTTEEDEPLVLTLGAARFVEVRISG